MKNKKKFTVIVIVVLAVVVFLTPYLYKKFWYDPIHSDQAVSER